MPRAVSIHIGVDRPRGGHVPLRTSESNAWRMAGLASQAGYQSLLVLRGQEATKQAVHDALTRTAGTLGEGDVLLLTFSGHGCQLPENDDLDERSGRDQGWCLADGELVDDKLAGYWRLFEPGVRIVLVSESCYSGGVAREDEDEDEPDWQRNGGSSRRGLVYRDVAAADYAGSCIGRPPRDPDGIRASLLLLSASREEQTAEEGLFADQLLAVWNEGRFEGSYCDLYRDVRERVMNKRSTQDPQILMLGAGDLEFPLAPAFHVDRWAAGRSVTYRS